MNRSRLASALEKIGVTLVVTPLIELFVEPAGSHWGLPSIAAVGVVCVAIAVDIDSLANGE
ncbi:hypothetical protein QWY84_15405 [Aquisalimonas lutea]|uniref:hypothetical protein n=1 Tax=Aquisalimonas lutea TaxID=1327750 RepID=UPI0025B5A610|nr:hypothetical protein [Aquisalimonas lutea]MDN3519004.1 hypothetical protein [Aquisalimonas lutea]